MVAVVEVVPEVRLVVVVVVGGTVGSSVVSIDSVEVRSSLGINLSPITSE